MAELRLFRMLTRIYKNGYLENFRVFIEINTINRKTNPTPLQAITFRSSIVYSRLQSTSSDIWSKHAFFKIRISTGNRSLEQQTKISSVKSPSWKNYVIVQNYFCLSQWILKTVFALFKSKRLKHLESKTSK